MLKSLISSIAFVAVAANAGVTVLSAAFDSLSSSTRTNTFSVSVAKGDHIVALAATNKKRSQTPVSFASSAGPFVVTDTADAYPTSYAARQTASAGGTVEVSIIAEGSMSAVTGVYVTRADSGVVTELDLATYLDEDGAAAPNGSLSYEGGGALTNALVLEAFSSRTATLVANELDEDANGGDKRFIGRAAMNGSSFASTYALSGGNAGQLTASGVGVLLADTGPALEPPTPQTDRTNIVLIVIDDLGWMDLSVQGSEFYETPRIDELANNGMRFTQGYAAHPRCLPSRYGMMTGRFPGANGVPGGPENCLRPEEVTIAEALRDGGYATCFAGKWHLIGKHGAANLPQNQGFDVNFSGGKAGAPPTYFYPYRKEGTPAPTDELDKNALYFAKEGQPGEYVTDRLTDEAIGWMTANADQPMFLSLWHYGVHTPYEAPADLIAKYEAKLETMDYGDLPEYVPSGIGESKRRQDNPVYAAMVESVDINVGRLMDHVEALGIADNTVFIFTSDNGGLSNRGGNNNRQLATSNWPLREGKGWLNEGGIREAFIVSGAGVETMVNSNAVVTGSDVFPACLEIAGLEPRPADHHDGVSFAAALTGADYDRGEPIFWHSPQARPYSTGDFNSSAVREGDYKLIWFFDTPGEPFELYNVRTDPGERNDLAQSMPELAAELLAKIKTWHEGSGVVFRPDEDDVARPPKAYLKEKSVPLSMRPAGATLDLSWGAYRGFDFEVSGKTNLRQAAWTPLAHSMETNGLSVPLEDAAGFFKVELALQQEG